jgi:hypothetical protein
MKETPMVNTDCLEGIRCPDCGNEEAFYIETSAVMYVTDDGAESRGDTSWNDDSHTQCAQCELSGKLATFRVASTQQYTVASSHGLITVDANGKIIGRRLDNKDVDGGSHIACITRFDLAEWRAHWGNPDTSRIDILDLGYWYTKPGCNEPLYAPPDAQWRKDIAEAMLKRIPVGVAEADAA